MRTAKTIGLLCLVLGAICLAQEPFHNSLVWRQQQWQSTGATFLPPGLAYRWVASDLLSSPVSSWVDRIQAVELYAPALSNRLILSGNKVSFYGTNWLVVADAIPMNFVAATNFTLCLVCSQAQPAAAGAFMGSTNASDYISVLNAGNAFRWGAASFGPIADNTIVDILVTSRGLVYTNNLFALDQSGGQGMTGFKSVGIHLAGEVAKLTGSIYEILIWTNMNIPLPDFYRTNIHTYCVTNYGVSP